MSVAADWEDDWVETKPMGMTPNTLSPVPSATPITKEDKAAELARRKEERKQVGLSIGLLFVRVQIHFPLSSQRIAMLKEQKKSGAKGS